MSGPRERIEFRFLHRWCLISWTNLLQRVKKDRWLCLYIYYHLNVKTYMPQKSGRRLAAVCGSHGHVCGRVLPSDGHTVTQGRESVRMHRRADVWTRQWTDGRMDGSLCTSICKFASKRHSFFRSKKRPASVLQIPYFKRRILFEQSRLLNIQELFTRPTTCHCPPIRSPVRLRVHPYVRQCARMYIPRFTGTFTPVYTFRPS